MTPAQLTASLQEIFSGHGVTARTELMTQTEQVACESTQDSSMKVMLRRFETQLELLSGGPVEIGEDEYRKVLELAKSNIFEACAYVEETYDFTIGLGGYVIESKDELDLSETGVVYWNPHFGWVEGIDCAYGYASLAQAQQDTSKPSEVIRNIKDIQD